MKTIEELWQKVVPIELVQIHPPEGEAMYKRVLEFDSPFVIEVGSAHGASTVILAEAVKEKNGFLHCFDTYPEDYDGAAPGKFGEYAKKAFYKNVREYKKYIAMHHEESYVAKTIYQPGDVSFIFIDGDHSYEGVKADCKNLLDLLEPGGYVAFHDHNNPAFAGVEKAAREFCGGWVMSDRVWDLAIYKKPYE